MRILIVEDEAAAARRLKRLVAAELPKAKIVAVDDVDAAAAYLARERADLVLLDLDLGGRDGFEVVRRAGPDLKVVVVSACADRAIDAFDHAVIDFVTKPVSAQRLVKALARAREPLARAGETQLVARGAGRIDLIPTSSIVGLSGADDYVEVVLADGRTLLHDATLDDLEPRLPAHFIRTHRSHIINLRAIASLRSIGRGQRVAVMTTGREIPVSRRRAAEVTEALARR